MRPIFCTDANPTFFGLLDVTIAPALLYYAYIPTLLLTFLLAIAVTAKNPSNRDARLFVSIAIALGFLVAVTFLQWIAAPITFVMFSWQLWNLAFVSTFVTTAFFVYSFTLKQPIPPSIRLSFYLAVTPIIWFIPTTLNIEAFDLSWCQGVMNPILLNYTYLVCSAAIGLILFAAFRTLSSHTNTDLSRAQLHLVFLSSLSFLLLFLVTTVLGDIINDYRTEIIGPLGTLLFLVGITYVAAQKNRFNIGFTTTELITILIATAVGALILVQSATFIKYVASITFVIVLALGLVLSRSIRKEIKQREYIEKLASDLEQANVRLQALDKQKSEFVSIASHQLRSPLTSIRGYASLLLEGSYGKIPKKAAEPLERIEQSSKHMATTIEDYLNVSRIESGNMKYNLSDFNLRDEVEHICDDLRSEALKSGLILLFRTNLNSRGVIHADIGKTVQIIQNLVTNAIKYTRKGTINVLVRDDITKKRIYVDIIDTGIGMNQKTLHTIFQKFERAENANSVNVHGTGLGLFVSLKMAEAMGGTITAHSDGDDRGSRFTLELPLAL